VGGGRKPDQRDGLDPPPEKRIIHSYQRKKTVTISGDALGVPGGWNCRQEKGKDIRRGERTMGKVKPVCFDSIEFDFDWDLDLTQRMEKILAFYGCDKMKTYLTKYQQEYIFERYYGEKVIVFGIERKPGKYYGEPYIEYINHIPKEARKK
jgi:hypothetical protein